MARRSRGRRQLLIDRLAGELLKHVDGPLLEPERAIAVTLSIIPARWSGRRVSEDSLPVRLILHAIKSSGYDIVPRRSQSRS